MALHYDFPYIASRLYCKSCKQVTEHAWTATEYKCSVCGRKWTPELIRVSLKQDQYGELLYECILSSDRPVNSSTYTSVSFKTLEECQTWLREQVDVLREEMES